MGIQFPVERTCTAYYTNLNLYLMENIIELHRTSLKELETKAIDGVIQLREFSNLMLEKVEAEKASARASKKLSTFELKALNGSKYGKIFVEMVNVAESKSIQSYDLAKNIYQDIYDPLIELIENQRHAINALSHEGNSAIQLVIDHDSLVKNSKSEYFRAKTEMETAVRAYENFKSEDNDEETINFYKNKLFRQMNTKMRISQEKSNYYDACIKRANECLRIHSHKMQEYVRVFNELNYEQNQLMIDSLNKLVIFETSVDMNLKYDTKMFSKMIEQIQITHESSYTQSQKAKTEESKEESKEVSNPELSENNIETGVKEVKVNSTIKENSSLGMDPEYLSYIIKFDQIGEYRYSEPIELSKIEPINFKEVEGTISQSEEMKGSHSQKKELKLHHEVFEIFEKCWNSKIDLIVSPEKQSNLENGGSDPDIDQKQKFEALMSDKVGRTAFLECFNYYKQNKDIIIPTKEAFHNLSVLVLVCFDKVQENDDRENALQLLDQLNRFYIEIKEQGKPPRMYLTKCIERHKMLQDLSFWEKIIFESIRKGLRDEFSEYEYQFDVESAYRELIYAKLSLFIMDMLSFHLDKKDVKEVIVQFCESHELTHDQRISLIAKVANFGKDI